MSYREKVPHQSLQATIQGRLNHDASNLLDHWKFKMFDQVESELLWPGFYATLCTIAGVRGVNIESTMISVIQEELWVPLRNTGCRLPNLEEIESTLHELVTLTSNRAQKRNRASWHADILDLKMSPLEEFATTDDQLQELETERQREIEYIERQIAQIDEIERKVHSVTEKVSMWAVDDQNLFKNEFSRVVAEYRMNKNS